MAAPWVGRPNMPIGLLAKQSERRQTAVQSAKPVRVGQFFMTG